MPMVWNDTADVKLFMAVLSTTNPKLNYQQLADIMGPGCTPSAIQHRIQRLKAMVANNDNATTNNGTNTNAEEATELATTTSVPSSPEQAKKKRGRPAKKTKDTDEPAPKKVKKAVAKRTKKAKATADSDETEEA
ncbi:uncharacterized protein BDW47DRAFT_122578 [Aspergillus candidus]|uniref:AT hook motif protein n=1 Tax=Aspergillus candidus TaxID=41067 RepID=A0A2I2FLM9_ASPCN|nr:hypothetical protein BDW47DRAFT_122578 [Aspergillus candidus]PLB41536.1 hypothetical protein BDW47DRAFT_122578 [Aspergillus candidus]